MVEQAILETRSPAAGFISTTRGLRDEAWRRGDRETAFRLARILVRPFLRRPVGPPIRQADDDETAYWADWLRLAEMLRTARRELGLRLALDEAEATARRLGHYDRVEWIEAFRARDRTDAIAADDDRELPTGRAARHLGVEPKTLLNNWKTWGLRPRRLGGGRRGPLVFRVSDLERFKRQAWRRSRSRP